MAEQLLRCITCSSSFLSRYRNRYECPDCAAKRKEACMKLSDVEPRQKRLRRKRLNAIRGEGLVNLMLRGEW